MSCADGSTDCELPELDPAVGRDGEFVAPPGPEGHRLKLELTATDSEGASASTDVALNPRMIDLLVESKHEGARVSVAGERGRTPMSATVLRRSSVRIATPLMQHAPNRGGKAKLEWRRWSDHGERKHEVSSRRDRTYRACYGLLRP